jgi:outer membrane lipoprotein-sorting protein
VKEDYFFNHHIAPRLKAWGTYDRLENMLGSVPDVNYVVDGTCGWLETKIVHSGKVYFEKFQLPWLFKRARYQKTGLWVLASDGKSLWMWDPKTLATAPRTTERKWTVLQVADLESAIDDPMHWDWDLVRHNLAHA